MSDPVLKDIIEKLEHMEEGEAAQDFTRQEVIVLKGFVVKLNAIDGFVSVVKTFGIVLATIVVIWTQGERIMEILNTWAGKHTP